MGRIRARFWRTPTKTTLKDPEQALDSSASSITSSITLCPDSPSFCTTMPALVTPDSKVRRIHHNINPHHHLHRTSPISPVSVTARNSTSKNDRTSDRTTTSNNNNYNNSLTHSTTTTPRSIQRQPNNTSQSQPDEPVTTSTAASSSLAVVPTVLYSSQQVSRARELAEKRVQLCRQRVRLEQGLFEHAELDHKQTQAASSWKTISVEPACCSSSESSSSSSSTDLVVRRSTPLPSDAAVANSQDYYPTLASLRWESMEFPDGQVYQGQVLVVLQRTRQHSAATYTPRTHTTTTYVRHGHGMNRWPDGQVYRGAWQDNSRHGRGTHTWPDGRSVTGPWKNGHLHGRIFFVWPDHSTYDGDAVEGKKQGRGVHTWGSDRTRVYVGQYEAGYEHGFGTLTECGGGENDDSTNNNTNHANVHQPCKYRGQFRYGKRHGYGVQIWTDKTYDGEWESNMVHGRGKLSWSNGASYTGGFKMGRYHGSGCYVDALGKKYIGSWQMGRREGMGKQYWANGDVYHGHFVAGKRHGYGQMRYADGRVYSGGWKAGKRSGRGIEVAKNGGSVVHCGVWKRNRPVVADSGRKRRGKSNRPAPPKLNKMPGTNGGKAKDDCDFHWTEAKNALSVWPIKEAESVSHWRHQEDDEDVTESSCGDGGSSQLLAEQDLPFVPEKKPQDRSLDDTFYSDT